MVRKHPCPSTSAVHRASIFLLAGLGYTVCMRALRAPLFLLLAVYMLPFPVQAARVYLDPGATEQGRLDTWYLPVRIDTEGACINAVTVKVNYDPALVSVIDTSRGNSIIPLWVDHPSVAREEADQEVGVVSFTGGIPGGYCGRVLGDPGQTNTLLTLVVTGASGGRPLEVPVKTLFTLDPTTTAYLHDGTGMAAAMTLLGTEVTLYEGTSTPANVWLDEVRSDTIAPELFDITLVRGPSEGNVRHYIVFSTTDKQSGIDHYEVRETDPLRFGFLTLFPDKSSYWIEASSPYILRDQTLRSKILVKAVDKNGNERIVTLMPELDPLERVLHPTILALLAVIIGVLALIIVLYTRRRRTTKRPETLGGEPHDHETQDRP